jgi:fructose-1,6-bisphosphatase/inositol monophosphatase family enzyme
MPSFDVTDDLHTAVLAAMQEATDSEVMPRWRALAEGDVRTKSAEWDVVTDADVLAERRLTLALRTFMDIPVVGEEASAANPALVDHVSDSEACWLVDPVDGTKNFVEGREDFACMVALVVSGRTQGAWITHPAVGRRMWGARGAGAHIDGEQVVAPVPRNSERPSGAVGARLFMEDADAVHERSRALGPVQDIRFCAGWDYYDLLVGAKDYVLFSRSLPWDHAPGGLLAQEAGLRIGRFNGDEYLPGDGRKGLLTAHPTVWERVRDGLGIG